MNNAMLRPALGGSGLNVTGNVSLLSSSNLVFQLGGTDARESVRALSTSTAQSVLAAISSFHLSIASQPQNSQMFHVLTSTAPLTGAFANVASGNALATSDGSGAFMVDYSGSEIVLSDFMSMMGPQGLNFAGANSATGNGGNGGVFRLTTPSINLGPGSGQVRGAHFNGGNATPGSSFLGGDGGTFAVTATTGDVVVGSDIEASSGASGSDVVAGKGGSVSLTANRGAVTVNKRIQVSDKATNRRSSAGGNITLKSGKTSGVAINISNSGQLLALLDAASPGPGGKIVIQAKAVSGDSQVNVSGKLEADKGLIDIRHSSDRGQINLTNADLRADTIKVAALGNNGRLQIGGGTISADTILQLYAPIGNGQVVFIANATLSGAGSKYIAGDSVTINNGVIVNVTGPAASVYVNSTNGPAHIPKANYTGFGGNSSTTGTFSGSGANAPQPLSRAPSIGTPPGG